MTRTAPTPVRIDCAAQLSSGAHPRPVTLVWDLSSRVCARFAASFEPGTPTDLPVAVELLITPEGEKQRASVSLRFVLGSGARRELIARIGVPSRWLYESGFEHLDTEGIVSCTFRSTDTSRPVLARCLLFEQAGIPAGSYSLRDRER